MRFRSLTWLFLAGLPALAAGGPAARAQYDSGTVYIPGRGHYYSYGAPRPRERAPRDEARPRSASPPGYRVQPQYGGRFQPAPPSGGLFFPWFSPAGAQADGSPGAQPTEEEIERRIQASGLNEETIVQRTQRMMELQASLLGEDGNGNGDRAEAAEEPFPEPPPYHGPQTPLAAAQAARIAEAERAEAERLRQAHVEDADDE